MSFTDHLAARSAAAMTDPQLLVPDPAPPGRLEALRLRASATLLPRMLAYFPANTTLRTDLADVLWLLQRYPEAIAQYQQSLQQDRRQPHALLRCGVAHMELNQPEAALQCFNDAVKLAPQDAEPHFRKSTALGRLMRHDEARHAILRALQLSDGDARLHNQQGVLHLAKGELDLARDCFDRALSIEPAMAKALCNRGLLLLTWTRYDEARQALEAAVKSDPTLHAAHANLGLALMWLRQPQAAQDAMRRALACKPDPVVSWNLGCLHLQQGEWARGWPLLEARWDGVLRGAMPSSDRPIWQGEMPIAGRTLLIHPEQGLGDFVQFCRYAPLLAQAGAKVILHTPRELVRLMRTLPGDVTVIPKDQPVPAFDARVAIMSLPGALRTGPSDVPYGRGYLHAPHEDVQRWAHKLGARQGLRVGLVWSGGHRPDQPELSALNQRRNIPLRDLAPLGRLAAQGVRFYSLQKGKEAEAEWHELQTKGWSGPQLIDLMGDAQDFADTAALISQLDLVIAVDTSTAHVAAALGKPVWVLNRHDTCWRWMFDRSDTPWYSSMRIFRQSEPGHWGPVVAEVTEALEAWCQDQSAQAQSQAQAGTELGSAPVALAG